MDPFATKKSKTGTSPLLVAVRSLFDGKFGRVAIVASCCFRVRSLRKRNFSLEVSGHMWFSMIFLSARCSSVFGHQTFFKFFVLMCYMCSCLLIYPKNCSYIFSSFPVLYALFISSLFLLSLFTFCVSPPVRRGSIPYRRLRRFWPIPLLSSMR